ncbi:MAG: phosphatidate cytidylyltransferase [Treponema sp.]|nr:phosphatidate cytidylyltransferase [Treponema sp.]
MIFINDKRTILKEVFRKSIHLCSAFVPLLLKYAYWPVTIAFGLIVTLYLISECLRLKGIHLPLISLVTETAARKNDDGKIVLGPVTLVFGIFIASFLLPLEYARVGIYSLAFGDGLASLVGRMFGKTKLPYGEGKSFIGSLACFCAVFCSTFIVSGSAEVSLLVAYVTMVVEVLPLGDFDNLIIPVSMGFWFMLLCKWFGLS